MERHIRGLDLIANSKCNMKCEFCYLHKNKAFEQFNKEVLKAWDDGSYIENVYQVIKKINADPKEIRHMSLWGGETTLYMPLIQKNAEKIFEYFPECNNFHLSSNWMTDYSKVADCINYFLEVGPQRNGAMAFGLQASVDGPPGLCTEHGHPGNYDKYYENFCILVDKIFGKGDPKNLYHLKVPFNATISKEVYMEIFSTEEKIYDYYKYMNDFYEKLQNYSNSTRISIGPSVPGIALPFAATAEEGEQLAHILIETNNVFEKYEKDLPFFRGLSGIRGSNRFLDNRNILIHNMECGALTNSLTIIPDGTIVECNGSYIDAYEPYRQSVKEEGNDELYDIAELMNKFFYNPLKMSEEEIDRMNLIIDNGYRNNFTTCESLKLALIDELALSKQIPAYFYRNYEMNLRYIAMMSQYCTCSRENMKRSYTPYIGGPEEYRRFLNGTMQYLYSNENSKIYRGYCNNDK